MKVLIKEELIVLVRKIMNVEGSEEEVDNMIELLKSSIPLPEVSDLIYWNENELTAEQVVEQALSYKPIQL
ncbi:bacteriocin immunity protein [Paenibacillus sp. LjRoot56]|uniref:bacteriocin immunity protein n=1 Tax=Paenibacillus sp. LjRoot56 TaxID=3342333 RepID=UPI003ECF10AA